jgi:hypothetical protein
MWCASLAMGIAMRGNRHTLTPYTLVSSLHSMYRKNSPMGVVNAQNKQVHHAIVFRFFSLL